MCNNYTSYRQRRGAVLWKGKPRAPVKVAGWSLEREHYCRARKFKEHLLDEFALVGASSVTPPSDSPDVARRGAPICGSGVPRRRDGWRTMCLQGSGFNQPWLLGRVKQGRLDIATRNTPL
jgi:hypothetical protein